MAADKLSIIAGELAQTGDNIPAAADNGSDEWTVCSPAYDSAVAETIEGHSWNFDTNITALVRDGDSPDEVYDDAFAKPNACLHLIWVRLDGQTVDYKIINNQVCLNARGRPVTAKYILDQGAANWPALFVKVIAARVRAAIFCGLHEDPQTGLMWEKRADQFLAEARTRVDQESPKRAMFNSRARASRYTRRPFVSSPMAWTGTGDNN